MRLVSSSLAALLFAWLLVVPFSPADAGILVTIDKAAQQMSVEIDGVTRFVWPVSTGRRGYETPSGSFKPFRLEEDHYSKEWDEAPMPYSIFFTDGGHAIHGSYEIRRLGRRASHGCVRLAPKNAAKLFALVKQQGLGNTRVVVLADPNAPIMVKRDAPKKVQQTRKPAFQQARKPAEGAPAVTQASAPAAVPHGAERAFGYAPGQPFVPPSAEVPTAAAPEAVQTLPVPAPN